MDYLRNYLRNNLLSRFTHSVNLFYTITSYNVVEKLVYLPSHAMYGKEKYMVFQPFLAGKITGILLLWCANVLRSEVDAPLPPRKTSILGIQRVRRRVGVNQGVVPRGGLCIPCPLPTRGRGLCGGLFP